MDKFDAKIVDAARNDPQEYEKLYRKYIDRIYNYFWYRVGHDPDVAEDLAQETFVRAYRHLPRFTPRKNASYLSYLLSIAHNLLVNYYRSPKPISLDSVGDVPEEVWQALEERDAARRLWHAIQQLPPAERDILYLKYRRGYKVSEIAQIVGKTENAVKLVLSRVRKKLAKHPYLADIVHFKDQDRTAKRGRYEQR